MPKLQLISDLPKERIAIFKPPFTITEADCFGQVTIKQYKQPRKSKNNQIRRNWFLFTHLTTKPVRLDLSRNITTNSFLMTLQQFTLKRISYDILGMLYSFQCGWSVDDNVG